MINPSDLTTPETPVLTTRRRGPNVNPTRVAISIRIDPAVLDAYKATGPGWQRRMHEAIARGVRRVKAAK